MAYVFHRNSKQIVVCPTSTLPVFQNHVILVKSFDGLGAAYENIVSSPQVVKDSLRWIL